MNILERSQKNVDELQMAIDIKDGKITAPEGYEFPEGSYEKWVSMRDEFALAVEEFKKMPGTLRK